MKYELEMFQFSARLDLAGWLQYGERPLLAGWLIEIETQSQ